MKLASVLFISIALIAIALIFVPERPNLSPGASQALEARVCALEADVARLNERQSKTESAMIDRGNILARIAGILESCIADLKEIYSFFHSDFSPRYFGPQSQPADQQQKATI